MQRLGTGYTNTSIKTQKAGRFSGKFKSIHIDSNEYLLHLSAYVNLNDASITWKEASKLTQTNLVGRYMGYDKKGFCEKGIVLGQFKNVKEYRTFAEESLTGILEKRYGGEVPNMEEFLLE